MTLVSDYAKSVKLPKNKPNDNLVNWWSEATNLPEGAVHCQMNRRFCGSCPETPPCISATPKELRQLEGNIGLTSVWPCKLCTKEMRIKWSETDDKKGSDYCPCWAKASRNRIIKYKKWRAKHEEDNILIAKRHKVYNPKRKRNNERAREESTRLRYSKGRVCAECGCKITNRNQTGYCRKHIGMANNKTS